ncbi:F0F1 ATP synthase subunit alpha [Planctomycetota bacterium]|nr:F0F1 ATP synthase subunit alpha [Planctomycetota bacterium]
MKIKADEISSVLKKEIEEYGQDLELDEVGSITEVGDGIARIYGLKNAMAGELLDFPHGVAGLVLNLEEASVGAVLLGDYKKLREGDTVKRTGRVMSIPVGPAMIGRVVNPLGEPVDNKGPIASDKRMALDTIAPGISARQPVTEPLQTGLKAVDSMIPIGRGQRELIIGDRQTGKTAIAIDTIINQKDSGVICVYVAVGQKESTVVGIVDKLTAAGAMDYTIVVVAGAAEPAPMQYIAPYAGCTLAEYFMFDESKATLVVYDDLTKQAAAYRELSLLLRRPPGREAYPGDVFYLHSRLLERSCKMKDKWLLVRKDAPAGAKEGLDGVVYERHEGAEVIEWMLHGFDADKQEVRQITEDDGCQAPTLGQYAIFPKGQKVPYPHCTFKEEAAAKKAFAGRGDKNDVEVRRLEPSGGSLTALPIIETQEGEVSAYIPTNVISITDGQIYLEPNLFFSGIRPAINVGISVSRVGGNAQTKAMKGVAGSLKLDLASFWDLEAFAALGTELDAVATKKLTRGKRIVELLKQGQYVPMSVSDQVMLIFAANQGYLDELPVDRVQEFQKKFLPYVNGAHAELRDAISTGKKMSKETSGNLSAVLKDFVAQFKEGKTPDPRSATKQKADAK